jgi:hypothetical protein
MKKHYIVSEFHKDKDYGELIKVQCSHHTIIFTLKELKKQGKLYTEIAPRVGLEKQGG